MIDLCKYTYISVTPSLWEGSWVQTVLLTVFPYSCSTWANRGLFKRSCCKRFVWLLHFRICHQLMFQDQIGGPSDSFWCERNICATRHLSNTSTEGYGKYTYNFYQGCSFTDVSFPWSISESIIQSRFDLSQFYSWIIYMCVCFGYLTIYFTLLGITNFPFNCLVTTDRHTGPMYSNAHRQYK